LLLVTQFSDFIHSDEMTGLNTRIIWINVTLPGQEHDALDLNLKKYPSLEELAEEIVCVLDTLNISHVVCMGVGVGANIATHFSIKHSKRCLGLVLIEPISSSAGLIENFRFKLNRSKMFQRKKSLSFSDKSPVILKRINAVIIKFHIFI
jgi:pimeloyl-ACP methyl ester carboxylesterase